MKRIPLWATLLIVLVLGGCSVGKSGEPQKPSEPVKTAETTKIPNMSAYSLGTPIQSGSLTVIPVIYDKQAVPQEDYATLAEALKNGWIEIIEMPYGQVHALRVRNTGPKALLLLGGELLVGGKQDRVVTHDVVIPSGSTVEVEVNCVEHGRWTNGPTTFKSGGGMVPLSVREKANYGTQQEVWDKVSDYNAAAKAAPDRTTIRAGLENDVVQRRTTLDLEKISDSLKGQGNVVGMIIAIDGQPRTLEIFGSNSLFAASQSAILRGALADAALSNNPNAPQPSMDDCKSFFGECMNATRRRSGIQGAMNTFRADGNDLRGTEIAAKDYEAKPAASAAGLVHGTYSRSGGR